MAKNDFRVTSSFKVIIRICRKNVEKHLSFHPKDICSFPVFFFFFNSKTPEILSLVTLVANYHKFLLLPLVVKP